jgi:hypothetical protein
MPAATATTGTGTTTNAVSATAMLTLQGDPGFLKLTTLNNRGVHFFEQGNYIKAIHCFRSTLEQCKALTHQQQRVVSSSFHYCESPVGCGPDSDIAKEKTLAGLSYVVSEIAAPDQDTCSRMAYDCFMLQDSCIRMNPDESSCFSSNMNHIGTVVIYNCGLAFHLHGNSINSLDLLGKALNLYRQALSLLMCDISPESGSDDHAQTVTGIPMLDFLHLAVVNNIGIILRYDFRNIDTSQAYFCRLAVLVRIFQATYHVGATASTITTAAESDLIDTPGGWGLVARIVDEFLLNAVAFLCCPSLTVCARAA